MPGCGAPSLGCGGPPTNKSPTFFETRKISDAFINPASLNLPIEANPAPAIQPHSEHSGRPPIGQGSPVSIGRPRYPFRWRAARMTVAVEDQLGGVDLREVGLLQHRRLVDVVVGRRAGSILPDALTPRRPSGQEPGNRCSCTHSIERGRCGKVPGVPSRMRRRPLHLPLGRRFETSAGPRHAKLAEQIADRVVAREPFRILPRLFDNAHRCVRRRFEMQAIAAPKFGVCFGECPSGLGASSNSLRPSCQ